ncbi:5'-3' exoribonuclease 2-like [Styela clava]
MGVPAFFRWLSKKYSSIIVHCNEEKKKEINGVEIPVDTSSPNPNDVEFDNLYLDMNGIIHPCSHPEDRPAPKNEVEIMFAIFDAIDRIFGIVRPRRLLYMAIDGVAPRAKMNQQRSRRFRASKESAEAKDLKEEIISELKERGATLPEDDPKKERFDSNCITPGTEFMFRLAACLRFYIQDRINNDPGWKNIEVILSDANVPGEGEHKIMDFIRRQRGRESHDPNTHHCICGADADLIMLGLATHEPYFTIIREEFKPNQPRPCGICSQYGHEMEDCCGLPREKQGEHDELQKTPVVTTDYIFIRLNVVREYLAREMAMPGLPFKFDLENVLDDWVMMCFFVGNDFLPHLPSLEIREGAIDKLVRLYKDIVHRTGGYLTKNGIVNLGRVEKIMRGIGEMEDEIFRRRRQNDVNFREREKAKRKRNNSEKPAYIPGGQFEPTPLGRGQQPAAIRNVRQTAYEMRTQDLKNRDAASALRSMLKEVPDGEAAASSSSSSISSTSKLAKKRKMKDEEDDEPQDDVRLWEEGWKDRYYRTKFNVSLKDYEFRRRVVRSYVEGLCWVLSYYYQGCASWKWFFPFHYAPFASDFVDIESVPNTFPTTTKAKNPLEQLMCVFPAASGNFLPDSWRELMYSPDSPIIDFYPNDFKIDLNGKKYAWQGVALLPFVDEDRMMETLDTVYPNLTPAESKRNELGNDRIFVGQHHPLHSYLKGLYEGQCAQDEENAAEIDPKLAKGMSGTVWADEFCNPDSKFLESPLEGLESLKCNNVLSMCYKDPQYPEGHIFEAKLLPGAKIPAPSVKPEDWDRYNPNQGWKPRIGFNPNRTNRAQLDASGHRHLQHNLPRQRFPPPDNYGRQQRGGYQGNRNQGHYAWGSGNHRERNGQNSYHNQGQSYGRGGRGSHGGYDYHQQRQRGYDQHRHQGPMRGGPRHQHYQPYPSRGGYSQYGRY